MFVKNLPLFAFFSFLLLLGGCGYQFGTDGIISQYSSIAVPYVKGDLNGNLTSAIIKEISESGKNLVFKKNGDLILKISIIELNDENIGFRYDRNKKDRLTRSIIPTETRTTESVEMILTEACSGKVILGPIIISASVDFDHDYYLSQNAVNVFSLGQLTDYDQAKDAVCCPLNKALAKKIVDYVTESW